MAVMRRTSIPGTPLAHHGAISTPELGKIAAVSLLVVRPTRAMNVHEVTEMSLLAGINQLYAGAGANPRDTDDNAVSFIDAHWQPSGGFCATLMDETCDVEYTFYGLLALGAA
jgi:hypothetical protein